MTSNKKKLNKYGSNVSYNEIPSGHSLLKKNFATKEKQSSSIKNSKLKKSKLSNDDKSNKMHKKVVKFKFKTNVNMIPKFNKVKLPRRHSKSETSDSSSIAEIVTGNGLSVPVCSGEEVVNKFNNNLLSVIYAEIFR